jgi:hypothetical protein
MGGEFSSPSIKRTPLTQIKYEFIKKNNSFNADAFWLAGFC